jgi:hypothetical protein
MPVWRNGSRKGLKIPWSFDRVGSSPTTGTTFFKIVIDILQGTGMFDA